MVHYVIHLLNSTVLPLIDSMGNWFYALVLLVAVLESTFIIGTFIPGTVILFFFGFAASQDNVSLFWIIMATGIGAVIGDFISYFIGKYGSSFVKEHKGILRRSHIEYGKTFFHKHGGKSVFFGRFISPTRQIIPFIAGMVHMSYKKFIYLNIVGGFLWAAAYVGFGYYLGSKWMFVEKIVSRVETIILLLGLIGILVYMRIKRGKNDEKYSGVKNIDNNSGDAEKNNEPHSTPSQIEENFIQN